MATLSVKRGPTDNAVFSAHSFTWYGAQRLYWNGPGGRLSLMFGDALISIEHPSANGAYGTFREAREAARAFFSAMETEWESAGR
jgi:hypothetical protein